MKWLAESRWFTRERLLRFAFALAVTQAILFGLLLVRVFGNGAQKPPMILDFFVFWGASRLVEQGHTACAYRIDCLVPAISPIVQLPPGSFGWFYPPLFDLLIAGLAVFQLLGSYLLFVVLEMLLLFRAVVRIYPEPWVLLFVVGFSGFWINLEVGQNGFLTTALAGFALYHLIERPRRSALWLGLLSIKPQLLVLFPVALLAQGRWRALLESALWILLLQGVSVWLLGDGVLSAWWHSGALAQRFLEQGGVPYWLKMPTVFAAVKALGGGTGLGYALQGLVSVGVAFSVWYYWRQQSVVRELKLALLAAASLLISPYLFVYDLVWQLLPALWWVRDGRNRGWLPGERVFLIFWSFSPLAMILSSLFSVPVPIGTLADLLAYLGLLRRIVTLSLRSSPELAG